MASSLRHSVWVPRRASARLLLAILCASGQATVWAGEPGLWHRGEPADPTALFADRAAPASRLAFDETRRAFGPSAVWKTLRDGVTPDWWPTEQAMQIDGWQPGSSAATARSTDDFEPTLVALNLPRLPSITGGRIRGEYLDDLDDVTRIGGRLILDTQTMMSLDTEWNHWRDDSPRAADHRFWTGDVNLVARFGMGTPVRFQSGIGVNWLDDEGDTQYGFNSTYGLDVQLKNWLSIGGELDWGKLGGRELFHGRATAGLMLGGLEVYVGYDWYNIGSIDRKGPVAGVGLWF